MKYVIFKDKKDYFFQYTTNEGIVVLESMPYRYPKACQKGVKMVLALSCDAENFHHRKTKDDRFYYFEVQDENSVVFATSEEFETHEERTIAVKYMMSICGKSLKDLEMEVKKERVFYARGDYHNINYECYQDVDQQYYFQLLNNEGEPIFVSRSYDNKYDCKDGVKEVYKHTYAEKNYHLRPDSEVYIFDLKSEEGELIGSSTPHNSKEAISLSAAFLGKKEVAQVISDTELRKQEAKKQRLRAEKEAAIKEEENRRKAQATEMAALRRKEEEELRVKRRKEARELRKDQKERKDIERERIEEKRKIKELKKNKKSEVAKKAEQERLAQIETDKERMRLKRAEKQKLKTEVVKKPKTKKGTVIEATERASKAKDLMPIWIMVALLILCVIGFIVSNLI